MINSVIVGWLLAGSVNKLYLAITVRIMQRGNKLTAVLVSFTIYLMFVIFRLDGWRDVKVFL